MELLQIVPMLPPTISGVGDYALLLARELQASHSVQTRFLCGDPGWCGQEEHVAPFPSEAVEARNAAALLKALEKTSACQAVLLHYVGHGYEPRGCPFWLVQALEQWKHQAGRTRLIVLFHEVSGTGPVWTSGFWTAGLQTALAKRLARLGDSLRITTEIAAQRVRAMLPAGSGTQVRVQPVFSTMGEPTALPAFQERDRQMIVFGGTGWRRDAYTRYLPSLQSACRHLQIERVIDIGKPISVRPALAVPYVEAGVLPAREASALMLGSVSGFFTYPVLHLGKSTIFAAYCAHGMVPSTIPENRLFGDRGLQPSLQFLISDDQRSHDENGLAKLATAAHIWYRQHRLTMHASEIYQNLSSNKRTS